MTQVRQRLLVRFVVRGVYERFALVSHAVSEGHARMVEVHRCNSCPADLKRLALELVYMNCRFHVAERDRKIVGVHLTAQDFLERSPLPSRSVDMDRRGGQGGPPEERVSLNLRPMRVADKNV